MAPQPGHRAGHCGAGVRKTRVSSSSERSVRKGGGVHKAEEVVAEPEPEAPADEPEEKLAVASRPSSLSWGMLTTARRRCSTTHAPKLADGGWRGWRNYPAHRRLQASSTRVSPITFIDTPGHAIFHRACAPGERMSPTLWSLWWRLTTGSCRRRGKPSNHAQEAAETRQSLSPSTSVDLAGC